MDPLRPGTDGAVGLGWLNVIMENNLYDELWVKRWTNGPFLVCEDIEPSGWQQMGAGGPEEIKRACSRNPMCRKTAVRNGSWSTIS